MEGGGGDLLREEYREVNAHLRANVGQFVNWFSFLLTFSLAALAAFAFSADRLPGLAGLYLRYAIPVGFLLMHVLALVAIIVFRLYIAAADERVRTIVGKPSGVVVAPAVVTIAPPPRRPAAPRRRSRLASAAG